MPIQPFHLAFPINDLEETRRFYVDVLGCKVGRESEKWIDFDFFGHQISAHVKPEECGLARANEVDGDQVPVRHFGVVLEWNDWEKLAERVKNKGIKFIIEPDVRFKGKVGEQGTFFFLDPSGNALEFKTFKDIKNQLFQAG
jgi:extradiol dioxygenase family protein